MEVEGHLVFLIVALKAQHRYTQRLHEKTPYHAKRVGLAQGGTWRYTASAFDFHGEFYAVERQGLEPLAGAVIGFLTGIVVSTGPLSVPAFAAYGLVKGAFIATEAAGSLALYISKALTFRQFGALPVDIIVKGLISGSSVMAGTYTARLIVERLSVVTFQRLLDGVMIVSGTALLWAAIR